MLLKLCPIIFSTQWTAWWRILVAYSRNRFATKRKKRWKSAPKSTMTYVIGNQLIKFCSTYHHENRLVFWCSARSISFVFTARTSDLVACTYCKFCFDSCSRRKLTNYVGLQLFEVIFWKNDSSHFKGWEKDW